MVIGYHLILSMYGFWLPNDPRGSWSDFVRSWELFRAGGQATKTNTRRSVAGAGHNVARRHAGKAALARPPVVLSGAQAPFAAGECAILPRHTHLLIAGPPYPAEQAANLLKGAATRELVRTDLHPFVPIRPLPPMWAAKQWICYLNDRRDIERCAEYIRQNPMKENLPPQRWNFVRPV